MTENKTPTPGPFSRTHVAVCCILAAGTMWGCQGLPSRALAGLGMPALPIMVLRDLGGAALLALLFLLTDRTAFRVRLRELPLLALMGMSGVLGMNLLYYRSQQVSSLAVAAILLYTAPSIVVLFSTLIWKDPLTKRKLCALVLAFLGCSFVAGLFNGSLSLSVQGLLLGLGTALTYAETAQTLTAAGSDRIALTAIVTPTAGQILTVRNNTGNSVTYSNSTLTIVKLA